MPATSGASHAASAFLAIVLGSALSDYLSTHASVVDAVTVGVGTALVGAFGVDASGELAGTVVVATALAFAWGVAYHYARH